MNDNASLALGSARGGLGGLPQRLVQDGVVDEAAMLEAVNVARERKTSVVTQLVTSGAANARDIAVAASNEFGVPLFDLDAVSLDLETIRLASDKLMAKHRVLPLFRRGKLLFLAVADPTNQHAIDEIKFQTSLGIEAVIVEDDKLQKAVDKALEQVDNQMSALTDDSDVDLESLEVTAGRDELDDTIGGPDRALRQQGYAGCHPPRRFGYSLRAVREDVPRAPAHGRGAQGDCPAPGAAGAKIVGPSQSHVAPRHRRAACPPGRPHQDEAVQESRHRLS